MSLKRSPLTILEGLLVSMCADKQQHSSAAAAVIGMYVLPHIYLLFPASRKPIFGQIDQMFALLFIKALQTRQDSRKVIDSSSHKHYHLCVSAPYMHELALHRADAGTQISSDKSALYISLLSKDI